MSVALLSLAPVGTALAQVGGSISIESDYRLRGYSLSAGRPVATVQASYDDLSGVYASAGASIVFAEESVRYLGVIGNLGYARRISPATTLDVGVTRTQFRAPYAGARHYRYTELYVGAIHNPLLARLSYSPDYFAEGAHTLYGELEGFVSVTDDLSISAHAGMLTYISKPYDYRISDSTHYDWRVGAMQRLGNFEVHATVSGGGPGDQYYRGRRHSRTAITAGASYSF